MHRLRGLMLATMMAALVVANCGLAVADPPTPPTITITSPVEGQHYELNAAIGGVFVCDAGSSTVTSCVADGPVDTTTPGPHTFTVTATDAAGPHTKTVTYVVDPDTTQPTITITSPVDGQHYTLGSAINAAYSCDDTGGSLIDTCIATTPIDTTVGTHPYTVTATDHASNTATKTIHYTVDPDTTQPTITITSPVDGQHYALGSAINAAYTCDDTGGSLIDTCIATTAIDTTVGTHAYTVTASDHASNTATKTIHYTVDPDTTPPTVTITSPVDGQHYPFGTAIAGSYSCDDTGGSNIATCVATTAIDLSVGTHVFSVTATDGAGTATTKSVTYIVDAQAGDGDTSTGTGATAGGGTSSTGGGTSSGATASTGGGGAGGDTTTGDKGDGSATTTLASTPRVVAPTSASTTALTRGVTLSLSGLKPRSSVVLQVRRGLRTILVVKTTANAAGKAKLKIKLSRTQLRTLKGKTLTLRYTTTAANGKKKVVTKKLKVR
jgi:hypothetical protein